MRSFIAKRFETRPAGLSLDTEALARYADVIDLSIGDTDFTTDKRIIDAAYADALNGYTHYGDPKGDPELVDAVIQAWKEDFGQDIPREEVLVTTSSSIGMAQALLPGALCGCGSRLQLLAVCVQPCFPVHCCAAGHLARKRLLHLHKLIIAYIQATLDIILNIFF